MVRGKRQIIRAGRVFGVGLWLIAGSAGGQEGLAVVATTPAARALTAPVDTRITVRFDRPIFGASVTPDTFWAFGRWSGPVSGRFEESFDGLEMTLVPDRPFSAGELVTVFLSRDLAAGDGTTLRAAGYSFQFWVRSRGSGFDFVEKQRLPTRSRRDIPSRAYGGFGSDLDGDGFLDLTIVNEDTNDLRTFLNRGDRSGRLERFLRPPSPVGAVPSPSEPSDFDRDGRVDVAVANTGDRTVSILLGNGDGTFAPARHYPVGGEPRGIAVLDADGDGDVDVAATSFAEGRVTVLLNDGAGSFDDSRTFGAGGGERALAAGDMNGDGILDLVVGDLVAGEIRVYAGSGAATFELVETRAAGGEVWMLVLGDVDGDGDEDVAAVNSRTNNGGILLGDGAGGLGPPRMTPTDDFPLATDLADLDGDGDLDWVTSSFFGDWQLFENTGGGAFQLARSWDAPAAASCSIAMDLDNDEVVDLVLIDELEDRVITLQNRDLVLSSNFETGDTAGWSRARGGVRVVAPGLRDSAHALEVPVDEGTAFVEMRLPPTWRLSVSFVLDPGELSLGDEPVEIMRLGRGRGEVVLTIQPRADRYLVRARVRERDGFHEINGVTLRGVGTRMSLSWFSASEAGRRNGRLTLSRLSASSFGPQLDNHGGTVDRVKIGVRRPGRGASGSFLVDDVIIRR